MFICVFFCLECVRNSVGCFSFVMKNYQFLPIQVYWVLTLSYYNFFYSLLIMEYTFTSFICTVSLICFVNLAVCVCVCIHRVRFYFRKFLMPFQICIVISYIGIYTLDSLKFQFFIFLKFVFRKK